MSKQETEIEEQEVAEIEETLEGLGSLSDQLFDDDAKPEEEEPAEKPAEEPTDEEPAGEKPVEEPAEDDVESLLEKEEPEKGDWARIRQITKEAKKREKEALERLNSAPPAEEEPVAPAPKAETPSLSNVDVVMALVKAEAGDVLEGQDAERIMTLSRKVVDKMGPDDLIEIAESMNSGVFGDYSDDVRRILSFQLPLAQARQGRVAKQKEEERSNLDEHVTKVDESRKRVVEKNPDMGKEDSDLYKFAMGWIQKNIGKVKEDASGFETVGPFASLLENPDWPELIFPLINNEFQSAQAADLRKENELLKTRTALTREPVADETGQQSVDDGGSEEIDEIERRLAEKGTIGI